MLMGIVNVTPDSFSDGGKFLDPETAATHAIQLEADGADLLDLGAESTRPGSEAVTAAEQIRRLLPILERLKDRVRIPISVDTSSAEVADVCLSSGVAIVNDITGFRKDPELPMVCAKHEAGVVLMHMKGTPGTMQADTYYGDLLGEVHSYLAESVGRAMSAGIVREAIVVDPGIGFGKSFEQNYRLLGEMRSFADVACGVLAGPSRKAFTGEFSQRPADQRQYSTAAAVALAVLHGADIVRVHDVKEMRQVVDILDRFREIHRLSDE